MKHLLGGLYLKLFSFFKKCLFLLKNRSMRLGKNVQIIGMSNISLGKNVTFSDGVLININNRKEIELRIGNNSYIGRNNFFTSGKEIIIGNYFFSSRNCSFIGASHGNNIDKPYIMNKVDFSKTILIGTNVFIGANASVVGNVKIGWGSIIGACSVVITDIPPFSIAVGNPAKVVKYYDFKKQEWVNGQRKSDEYYISEIDYDCLLQEGYCSIPDFSFARTYAEGWL